MNRIDAFMLSVDRLFFLMALAVVVISSITKVSTPVLVGSFAPVAVTSTYLIRRTWKLSR